MTKEDEAGGRVHCLAGPRGQIYPSIKVNIEEDRTVVVAISGSVLFHPQPAMPSLGPSLCARLSDSA